MKLKRWAVAVAATAIVALGGSLTSAPAALAATPTAYFVDCSSSTNGSGSQQAPWNSIASVNAKSGGFGPGDSISFKAGTSCTGALQPSGSGANGSPITIGKYGSGDRPKIIASNGSAFAVKLSDQPYWTIQDLDVRGGTTYGVFVTVTQGVVAGVTLRNLNVHDVTGAQMTSKNTGLVVVSPTHDANNSTSARFDQVLIDGVEAHDTTLWSGIIVGSGTDAAWARYNEKRSTNVIVRNSEVYNIYGDGIVLFGVDNGLIERSVAHDTGIEPTVTIGTPNAIWTWSCDNCTVQYNEAYRNDSPGVDGGAYDVDYWSENTLIQYNYGYDNSAYCIAIFGADNDTTSNTVVRYNVCANNGTQQVQQRTEIEVLTWNGGRIDGLQIYGNTFIANHGVLHSDESHFTGSLPRTFYNNIIYSTSPNVNPSSGNSGLDSDYNVYYYTGGAYSNGEPNSIFADPKLVNPAFTGTGDPGDSFKLQAGSPAIDAGRSTPGFTGPDYWGNAVPRGNATDIGANESSYVAAVPERKFIGNGGFESGNLAGWGATGDVSVTSASAHRGSYSATVPGSSSGLFRTIMGLKPSTTYVLEGWVRGNSSGQSAYLYAKGFGGAEQKSAPVSSTGWTHRSVVFTTGANSTTAEVGLWRDPNSGTGSVSFDDAQLAANLVSNGGFESGLSSWSNWPSGASTSATAHSGTASAQQTGSAAGIYRTLTGLSAGTSYTLSGWVQASSGQSAYLYAKSFGGGQVQTPTITNSGWVYVELAFTTGSTSTSAEVGLWRDAGMGSGSVLLDDVALTKTS